MMNKGVYLDPRTRLFTVLLSVVLVFTVSDSVLAGVLLLMFLYLSVQGMVEEGVFFVVVFAGFAAVLFLLMKGLSAELFSFVGFMFFYFMRFILVVMASVALGKTSPGELVAALQKMRFSRSVVISLAVILRYMPGIAVQWRSIQDATRLRGVSMTFFGFFRHPVLMLECALVPLLMNSLKISDELAASAATRGIEYPGERSTLRELRIRFADVLVFAVLAAATIIFFSFR